MATFLDRVYARAPVALQHAMVSAFGARWYLRRFGPGFSVARDEFIARESFTTEQWHEYQTVALRELLIVATTRIPYYRREWARLGLNAGAIAQFRLDDLPSLPILEKEATRA